MTITRDERSEITNVIKIRPEWDMNGSPSNGLKAITLRTTNVNLTVALRGSPKLLEFLLWER